MLGTHRLIDLPLNRLDELFIKFWTLEGAVTVQGAAITIWRLKPLINQIVSTMGAAITIWRFIANDQSNRLVKFRYASLSHQIFLLTIRPDVRLGVQGR